MKRFKIVAIVLLIFCVSFPKVWAQSTSTQGKEFWVSFMGNGFKTRYDLWGESFTWLRIQLIVSAKRDCHCTIKNPNTGYEQSFSVGANSTYLFDDIPWEEAYMELEEYGQVLNKGLLVTADDTISVYCSNIAEMSFDASYILPTPALGDDYIIQTYDQSVGSSYYSNYHTSAFLIVATEEGETTIDITPTVNTLEGHIANEEYSITLHRGESYQVRSHHNYGSRDLSGTRVTARDCKKIAVFNGNNLTMVPDGGDDSDCVFEQAMPLKAWGKKFVVTASLGREKNDIVKITSAYDNNEILRNGIILDTLNTGESIAFELRQSDKSCFIEASQSCAVYLYNHSKDDDTYFDDGPGAPSMVWIAPIEQRINDITFSTFNYESEHDTDISDHYVNIIVSAEDIQHVYLDNELLSPLQFEPVNGAPEYRFFRKHIEHGTHHLTCANGFNAHIYGFGHARGYAYMVGSNAKNLSSSLIINNETILPNETYSFCANQEVTFYADVNYSEYDLLWDFGDGNTSTENPANHTYNEPLIYNASLLITTDEGGCTGTSSNSTNFIVDTRQQYITESDEVCAGELYSGFGFSNVHINNDTILTRLQNNPIHSECQDSLLVYITSHENYHIPINDSRCWQGQPSVYDAHGFSFIYDHPGIYDRQLSFQTIEGCDSILTLHLTVDDQITHEFSHHECSESYVWDGRVYSSAGDYEYVYTTPGGCDSIVTMHLTMGLPQHTSFDTITCGIFYWNGQEYSHTGTYQQQFVTYDGCDSIVECHLTLSGNVEGTTIEVSECDSYHWLDSDYTESGIYEKTLSTILGCDSIVHLNLDLEYTPNPTDIYPKDPENTAPHWVVTATEFQIKNYEFTLWDHNNACHWDSITWAFESDEVHWVIEPDTTTHPVGGNCKIYVLNQVDDTVWLSAKVYNKCHPEGIERRYWFICSFYGLDEDSPSTGSVTFNVAPNPNNGQMQLLFENLIGKIDLKIYDMHGALIDQFQVNSDVSSYSVPFQCKSLTEGLYFFVATWQNKVLTKKVIISP